MTTKTKNDGTKSQASEQSTFAPLGKYAAIAVVLVGIIVTTAIMLNKQLNKTETEIASIENEVSMLNKAQTEANKAHQSKEQAQVAAAATEATIDNANVNSVSVDSNAVNVQQSNDVVVATSETTTSTATVKTDTDSNSARIASHKVQQKTRMAEMFDRIAKQEKKQLEQFKTQQTEQLARLRQQFNVQQYQIDALIQRNENMFNLRSASTQRNQAQREQMLNHI